MPSLTLIDFVTKSMRVEFSVQIWVDFTTNIVESNFRYTQPPN